MSIAGGSPAVLRDVLRNGLPDLVSQRIVDFTFTIHPSNAPEGATLLHLACEFSTVSLIAFLVDVAKVKKEEKDSRGETPLFKAVAKHQFASIHYLVHTAKVNLYSFNNLGLTVLHMGWWAPRAGPMVQFLIEECEMEVDTTDGEGRTILHMLARSGTEDSTVSWLVETQGASVTLADKDGCTALHWAAGYSGSVAAAKILLNHGASIEARNKKGETALFMSCKRGFTVFCRFLVESWNASVHSACPSGQGTLLHASVRSEWTFTMVEFLIEKGVNVYAVDNAAEETCLHMAVKRIAQLGTLRAFPPLYIIRALVQAGGARLVHAVRGPDKSTALHYAAKQGHLDVVMCLVDGGDRSIPFINAVDCNGDTALDLAVASGHKGVVKFLTQAIVNDITL